MSVHCVGRIIICLHGSMPMFLGHMHSLGSVATTQTGKKLGKVPYF